MLVMGWTFSSNKNEGIRVVVIFLRKDATRTKKHKKHKKHKTGDFPLLLRFFYVHKNAAFFVLHIKKHKKHIKRIKTQISE